MLRLAYRLGFVAESVSNYCYPAALPRALPSSADAMAARSRRPAFEPSSSTKDTGFKPSLTLFLLFMARQGQAP
jgi:hypothetical protein